MTFCKLKKLHKNIFMKIIEDYTAEHSIRKKRLETHDFMWCSQFVNRVDYKTIHQYPKLETLIETNEMPSILSILIFPFFFKV